MPQSTEEVLRVMVGGVDGWDAKLAPEVWGAVEPTLAGASDPKDARQKLAVTLHLAEAFQLNPDEVADQVPVLASDYARQKWGDETPYDQGAFYARLGKDAEELEQEGESMAKAREMMFREFGTGAGFAQAFYRTRRELIAGGSYYDQSRDGLYRQAMASEYERMGELAEKVAEPLAVVRNYLANRAAGDEHGFDGKQMETAALSALHAMPVESEEERKELQRFVINMAAGALEQRGQDQNERVGLGRKVAKAMERGGDRLFNAVGETMAKLAGDPGMTEFLDLRAELENAATGTVRPMAGTNYGARVLLGAAESGPEMAAMMTPPGMVASFAAAQVDLAREMRRNGLGNEEAEVVGLVGAVPYTALNWLSSRLVFGAKVPGLKALTAAFPSLLANTLQAKGKRAAVRFGLGWAEQTLQEGAQNAVEPTAQWMAAQFKKTIPGPDWDQWKREQAEGLPELLGVTALFAAVGAGTGHFRQDGDLSNAHALLGNERLLKVVGFQAPEVKEIRKEGNVQRREAAIERLWEKRDPESVSARQAEAQIAAEIEEVNRKIHEQRVRVERVATPGEAPRWVASRDGEVVSEQTSPEAVAADLPTVEDTEAPIEQEPAALKPLPAEATVEFHGLKFPVLEGVGQKVPHWKVTLPGETRGEVLTAEAMAARGFEAPKENVKSEPQAAEKKVAPVRFDGIRPNAATQLREVMAMAEERGSLTPEKKADYERRIAVEEAAGDVEQFTFIDDLPEFPGGRGIKGNTLSGAEIEAAGFRLPEGREIKPRAKTRMVLKDGKQVLEEVPAETTEVAPLPPEATPEEVAEHAKLTAELKQLDEEIAADEKALGELEYPPVIPPVPEDAPMLERFRRQKAVDKRMGKLRARRRKEKQLEEFLRQEYTARLELQAKLGVPGAEEALTRMAEAQQGAQEKTRDEVVMDYLRTHRLPRPEALREKGSLGGEVAGLDLPSKFFDAESRTDMDRIAAGLTEYLAENGDPEMAAKVLRHEQIDPAEAMEMFAQAWKAQHKGGTAENPKVPVVEGPVPPPGKGPGGSLLPAKAVAWADGVLKRRSGELHANPMLDPELMAAYTVKGAQMIEEGVRDFVAWSRRMVAEFGEGIRPYLRTIFQESVEAVEPADGGPGKVGLTRYAGQGVASALEGWSSYAGAQLRHYEFHLRRGTVNFEQPGEGVAEPQGVDRVVAKATEGWAQAIPRIRELRAKVFDALGRNERAKLNRALANRDEAETRAIMEKAAALPEFDRAREMLADLRQRLVALGEDIGWLEDYWPRWRKDGGALTGFLAGEADNPLVGHARAAAREQFNREPTEDEVALFLARGLRDPRDLPGSAKRREIDRLAQGMEAAYARWDDAAEHYVEEFTEAIAARQFFGEAFVPMPSESGAVQRIRRADVPASVRKLVDRWVAQGYVQEADAARTREVLEGRMGFQAIHKVARHLRDWGLISSITQVTTTISQLTDWWVAFSRAGGLGKPLVALSRVADATNLAVTNQSLIERKDFAMDLVTQVMIERGGLAPLLDSILKWSGLSYLNAMGQQTLMNVELGEMIDELRTDPTGGRTGDLLAAVFPNSAEQAAVRRDLLAGNKTEGVLALAWQRASHMIPTSLSEAPLGYLRHPFGRLFYTLKAFDLKRFDVIRREALSRLRSSVPAESRAGARQLVELTILFALVGGAKDMLNALITNRETDWEDEVESNLWKFVMLSRWAMRKGVSTDDSALETGAQMVANLPGAALESVLPPFAYVELPFRDAMRWSEALQRGDEFDWAEAESVKLFPVVGRAAYGWAGGGKRDNERRRKGEKRPPMPEGPLPRVDQ